MWQDVEARLRGRVEVEKKIICLEGEVLSWWLFSKSLSLLYPHSQSNQQCYFLIHYLQQSSATFKVMLLAWRTRKKSHLAIIIRSRGSRSGYVIAVPFIRVKIIAQGIKPPCSHLKNHWPQLRVSDGIFMHSSTYINK